MKFKQLFLSFCFAILLFLNTGCVAVERIDEDTVLLKFPVMNENVFPFNGKIFPLFKKEDEESLVLDEPEIIDNVIEENISEETVVSEDEEESSLPVISAEEEEEIAPDLEPVEEVMEVPETEKTFTLVLFPESDRKESVILNQETYKKILRILRTSE
ncbi:hypothetical protein [Spirulina sp. 06S082]|uniref:hypothetical protein n=1 Tax=Spirulina sp. 06S082 TaxID=3110248 RepID=UPI002B21C4FC|nr:hypothetical protein [Spirulina sp. 06S082]MEA5470420.1 hypothetical protein [Spirulina sp. 06S082]